MLTCVFRLHGTLPNVMFTLCGRFIGLPTHPQTCLSSQLPPSKFFSSVWKEVPWLSSQVSGQRVVKTTSRSQGPLLYYMPRRSWKPIFLKMMELTSKPSFPPYTLPSKILISKFVKGLSSVFLASGYWRVASYYRSIDLMLSMATATVSTLMHLSC